MQQNGFSVVLYFSVLALIESTKYHAVLWACSQNQEAFLVIAWPAYNDARTKHFVLSLYFIIFLVVKCNDRFFCYKCLG